MPLWAEHGGGMTTIRGKGDDKTLTKRLDSPQNARENPYYTARTDCQYLAALLVKTDYAEG